MFISEKNKNTKPKKKKIIDSPSVNSVNQNIIGINPTLIEEMINTLDSYYSNIFDLYYNGCYEILNNFATGWGTKNSQTRVDFLIKKITTCFEHITSDVLNIMFLIQKHALKPFKANQDYQSKEYRFIKDLYIHQKEIPYFKNNQQAQ